MVMSPIMPPSLWRMYPLPCRHTDTWKAWSGREFCVVCGVTRAATYEGVRLLEAPEIVDTPLFTCPPVRTPATRSTWGWAGG